MNKDTNTTNKFAFIDVQNTDTTTKRILGFEIDWKKLYEFLKTDWLCDKVFLYTGVDEGDIETAAMFEELGKQGCEIRAKTVFAYKNKDREIKIVCSQCKHEFMEHVDMGYNRKSNCDVDLTVDAMELAGEGNEAYIFTGDGDFEYLIRRLIKKGTKVHVVSSSKKIKTGPRYFTSRFSTKLRDLISENTTMVDFINIDNIRFKMEKE